MIDAEIAAGATIAAALIGGQFVVIASLVRLRNNHSKMNAHDPDETPLRDCSVGYFKTMIGDMLQADREEFTRNLLKIQREETAALVAAIGKEPG